jgi:predicted transcriptional regulator of viral defense system
MNLKNHNRQAGIGQVERQILETLSRLGKLGIRAGDLENEFGYTREMSNLMLSRLCKKGWLQRLQPGIYRIIPLGSEGVDPVPEDAWAIAVELFSPCYISGWTAAEHWELTEQIFNSTLVFTTQKQRQKESTIAGLKYRTKLITADEIFGIKKIWSGNKQISIADIHRTIIDILDDPEIGGGGRQSLDMVKEYFQHKDANLEILYQYAERLEHGAVFKRLGFVAEKIIHCSLPLIEKIHSKINKGIINLDPHGPSSGPIITKWGIRINIPLGDIS